MLYKWTIGGAFILTTGIALAHPKVQSNQPAVPAVDAKVVTKTSSKIIPAKVIEQIDELLSDPETMPTQTELQKIGPSAGLALRSIALDRKSVATRRMRAIGALIHFVDDETKKVFQSLVGDTSESYRIRGQAAFSLASTIGQDAVADLTPLLSAKKFRLREAAIKAFARIDSDAVLPPLKARLPVEQKAFLKEAIQQIISARLSKKATPVAPKDGDK